MNLQSTSLEGYLITEKETEQLTKLVLQQYKEAEKLILARLAELYASTEGLTGKERFNWLIQYDRNIKLLNDIEAIYNKYDNLAYGYHVDSGALSIYNNYYRQLYLLEWNAPITFSPLNPNLANYAVTGQIDAWKALKAKLGSASDWVPQKGTLSALLAKDKYLIIEKIQTTINSNLIAGNSYRDISRLIKEIIGTVNPDGISSGQLANALRIARTEGNRLMSAGAQAAAYEAQAQGISLMKMWDASFDGRTRPWHGAADGQTKPLDEPFEVGGELLMYPCDAAGSARNTNNCRCVYQSLVDGVKPTQRKGKNPDTGEYEVFSYKTYSEWVKEHGLKKNDYGQLIV